jgi:ribonuclease HI
MITKAGSKMAGAELWRVAAKLNGEVADSVPTLKVGDKLFVTDQEKAEALIQQYAAVSRSKVDEDYKAELRKMNEALHANCAKCGGEREGVCSLFNEADLDSVLASLDVRKSPGPDDIAYALLTHLPREGRLALLALINKTWGAGLIPTAWKKAELIPLYKGRDKDRAKPESYRPISLTSAASKVAEKMVRVRLLSELEGRQLLPPEQAGYRWSRCAEEQVAAAALAVESALCEKKVVCMLKVDLTKCFDRVWRAKLVNKLVGLGIPGCLVRWVGSFLSDRRARVRVDEEHSTYRVLDEGVPQGSVLGPVLCNVFLGDICKVVRGDLLGVELLLYADDLVIITTGTEQQALDAAQECLNNLLRWAADNRMGATCTVTLFSKGELARRSDPGLKLGDLQVEYDPEPNVLGIIFDERFTFHPHVKKLLPKIKHRMTLVRGLTGQKWGATLSASRALYLGLVQSKIDYGLGTYGVLGDKKALVPLESEEYRDAHVITGCVCGTRKPCVLREAALLPVAYRARQRAAVMRERGLRLLGTPLRRLLCDCVEVSSLVQMAADIAQIAGLEGCPRDPLPYGPIPHWSITTTTFATTLEGAIRSSSNEVKQAAAQKALGLLPPALFVCYTDGAVQGGAGRGGASVLLQLEGGRELTSAVPAGWQCTSYQAEMHAINTACAMIEDAILKGALTPPGVGILCSDSQAALLRLSKGAGGQKTAPEQRVWARIRELECGRGMRMHFQFIYGHSGVQGNEAADILAKQALELEGGKKVPLDFRVAKAAIQRAVRGQWFSNSLSEVPSEHVWAQVMRDGGAKWYVNQKKCARKVQTAVTQLRTNSAVALGFYRGKLRNGDRNCARCDEGVQDDAVHFLIHCKALRAARAEVFGAPPTVRVLTEKPQEVYAFLCKTMAEREE